MSQGQNTRALYGQAINLIPFLVYGIESLFGHGDGATKKQVLQGFLANLFMIGAGAAAHNNPAYAPEISQIIDQTAGALFPTGSTAPPIAAPAPPPPAPVAAPEPPPATP